MKDFSSSLVDLFSELSSCCVRSSGDVLVEMTNQLNEFAQSNLERYIDLIRQRVEFEVVIDVQNSPIVYLLTYALQLKLSVRAL